MREIISFSATKKEKKELNKIIKEDGVTRSFIIRSALQKFFVLRKLEKIREIGVPLAQKRGIFTDEDVFKIVS